MKHSIIFLATVALAAARPGFITPYHAGVAIASPVVSSQYHAQDELGQYSYGYAGGPSAKHEVKTFDGVTRGGYSYIDANGIVQSVHYVSDPIHGFRVAATNLPVAPQPIQAPAPIPVIANLEAPKPVEDTPEVAAAKAEHLAALKEAEIRANEPESKPAEIAAEIAAEPVEIAAVAPEIAAEPAEIAAEPAEIAVKPVEIAAEPAVIAEPAAIIAAPVPGLIAATPSLVAAAPAVFAAPAIAHAPIISSANYIAAPAVVSSQYHAQDELGQYSYGYAGGPSAKHEIKTFDGITRGGYSYIDANGILQSVHYVSDPIYGFRVAATNLPVAPVASGSQNVFIADAPDVAAAKAEHIAAHAEAKARL